MKCFIFFHKAMPWWWSKLLIDENISICCNETPDLSKWIINIDLHYILYTFSLWLIVLTFFFLSSLSALFNLGFGFPQNLWKCTHISFQNRFLESKVSLLPSTVEQTFNLQLIQHPCTQELNAWCGVHPVSCQFAYSRCYTMFNCCWMSAFWI